MATCYLRQVRRLMIRNVQRPVMVTTSITVSIFPCTIFAPNSLKEPKALLTSTPGGGNDVYTVALTGTSNNVGTAPDDNSPPPPPPGKPNQPPITQLTTIAPSVITIGGSTIVSTVPGSTATIQRPAPGDAASESSPPNPAPTSHTSGTSTGSKVGIAVGVVIGGLVLAALIAGAFFFYKRRTSSPDEPRHKHNTSVNPFADSGSAPGESPVASSHGPPAGEPGSCEDNRLDKGMVEHKRQSDGSVFEDSTDYSRRILKVTNPTDSE